MKIEELKPIHVGMYCYYIPSHGKAELGIIKSWNDSVVFVVYPGDNEQKREFWKDYTAAATSPEDLVWPHEYFARVTVLERLKLTKR